MSNTTRDTGGFRPDVGTDEPRPRGIDHSISPGVPCPETVLVAVMSDHNYLLVDYPQGEPAAFVIAEDAGLLRQGLGEAFGHKGKSVSGAGRGLSAVEARP